MGPLVSTVGALPLCYSVRCGTKRNHLKYDGLIYGPLTGRLLTNKSSVYFISCNYSVKEL